MPLADETIANESWYPYFLYSCKPGVESNAGQRSESKKQWPHSVRKGATTMCKKSVCKQRRHAPVLIITLKTMRLSIVRRCHNFSHNDLLMVITKLKTFHGYPFWIRDNRVCARIFHWFFFLSISGIRIQQVSQIGDNFVFRVSWFPLTLHYI